MKKVFALILLLAAFSPSFSQTTVTDSMQYDGVWRHYHVYIPANPKCALIIHLHGYSSNGVVEQLYTNYMPIADTAGFYVVYPEGLKDGLGYQYWNVGWPLQPNTDDVGFISALIDKLVIQYTLDPGTVFATGLSNGGFMCHKLACELSDKIAAIGSVSASFTPAEMAGCSPTRAVPVMEIHGTADSTVPYNGTAGYFVNVDTAVKHCVNLDQCNVIPTIDTLPHDLNTTNGTSVVHFVYAGGQQGSSVEFYKVLNGGHIDWPGFGAGNNNDFNASLEIWRFFRNYRSSDCTGLAVEDITAQSFSVYPNPSYGLLHINSAVPITTVITDLEGRQVLVSDKKDIDVSALSAGVYFIELKSTEIHTVQKFVKI